MTTCSCDIQCMIGLQTEILVRSQMKSGVRVGRVKYFALNDVLFLCGGLLFQEYWLSIIITTCTFAPPSESYLLLFRKLHLKTDPPLGLFCSLLTNRGLLWIVSLQIFLWPGCIWQTNARILCTAGAQQGIGLWFITFRVMITSSIVLSLSLLLVHPVSSSSQVTCNIRLDYPRTTAEWNTCNKQSPTNI